MKTYAIRRRNVWKNPGELETSARRSAKIGNEEMPDQVRWIRSYVLSEDDGTLGTVCIYQAVSPEAIREHARRVGMPVYSRAKAGNRSSVEERASLMSPRSWGEAPCGYRMICDRRLQ